MEASHYLGTELTVFQSEIYAINFATMFLISENLVGKHIVINSDSFSSIQALTADFIYSAQIKQTVDNLNYLSTTNNVELHWVKAHVGYIGNELADKLAKAGADDINNISPVLPNRPNNIARNMLREKVLDFWNKWWEEQDNMYMSTKRFFPKADKSKTMDILGCRRPIYSAIVQFITGFNFLNSHEYKVQKARDPDTSFSPLCRLCKQDEESTYHLLSHCE